MASLAEEVGSPTGKRQKIEPNKSVCHVEEDPDKSASQIMEEEEESDDEYYVMPPELYAEYRRQAQESEYFEVDAFSKYNHKLSSYLGPLDINDHRQSFLIPHAKEGLTMFNKEQKTNFEFVKLVRITVRFVFGAFDYFVTFDAKDAAAAQGLPTTTFQTMVTTWFGDDPDDLIFCRLKPTKKPGEPGRQEPTVRELCAMRGADMSTYSP